MSTVATELANLIVNLRNARQALIDRGFEISHTAGLKDFADAINNMPAPNNLTLSELIERTITELTAQDLTGVSRIGSRAFSNCMYLISVVIPDGIQRIYDSAFEGCPRLESVTLGSDVGLIGNYAFASCSSLESIVMPAELRTIGEGAFSGCTSCLLYDFTSATQVPTLRDGGFSDINTSCQIKVPAALYNEWINATNWSIYANYIVPV